MIGPWSDRDRTQNKYQILISFHKLYRLHGFERSDRITINSGFQNIWDKWLWPISRSDLCTYMDDRRISGGELPSEHSSLQRFEPETCQVSGDADKFLAWPTSRCRRTKSTVSERGACSCAELQDFSCYRGWKEACQATRAISTTSRRELSPSFLFLQGKAPKEIHAILKETLGQGAPPYATVKNWVGRFKRGDFSTCDAPRPGRPKTVTTPEIID